MHGPVCFSGCRRASTRHSDYGCVAAAVIAPIYDKAVQLAMHFSTQRAGHSTTSLSFHGRYPKNCGPTRNVRISRRLRIVVAIDATQPMSASCCEHRQIQWAAKIDPRSVRPPSREHAVPGCGETARTAVISSVVSPKLHRAGAPTSSCEMWQRRRCERAIMDPDSRQRLLQWCCHDLRSQVAPTSMPAFSAAASARTCHHLQSTATRRKPTSCGVCNCNRPPFQH